MNASGPVIEVRGLSFAYRRDAPVLAEINLTVAAGELVCVLGPNGAGKTTLLRCLLGQLSPSAGVVLVGGRDLHKYSRRKAAKIIAYVPQIPAAAFAFSVGELILMGRFAHTGVMGLASRADLAVARQAMIMTETLGLANRTLDELSGGEAQRVMVARALVQQPQVCLLDEPTSHLDIRNQLMIYRMMGRLAHDWGMAVLCVSHDLNLAGRFCDELVLMRGGRVLADGAPEQVIRKDILAEAYDVEIDLIETPDSPVPLVWVR